MSMNPWICPRCERVYSPSVSECGKCNLEVEKKIEARKIEGANEVLRTHDFNFAKCKNCGWGTNSAIPHNCHGTAQLEQKDIPRCKTCNKLYNSLLPHYCITDEEIPRCETCNNFYNPILPHVCASNFTGDNNNLLTCPACLKTTRAGDLHTCHP